MRRKCRAARIAFFHKQSSASAPKQVLSPTARSCRASANAKGEAGQLSRSKQLIYVTIGSMSLSGPGRRYRDDRPGSLFRLQSRSLLHEDAHDSRLASEAYSKAEPDLPSMTRTSGKEDPAWSAAASYRRLESALCSTRMVTTATGSGHASNRRTMASSRRC